MSTTEQVTATGHVIGATYKSAYWGYTYKVLGPALGICDCDDHATGVEVEQVAGDPSQFDHEIGRVWTHSTRLETGRRGDKRLS